MAGTQEVIREYLVSLGFRIDKQGHVDFEKTLESVNKGIIAMGKGLLLAATAIAGLVAQFATSMERLYYASQKANSTAANLKAIEYAGRQIGLTTEAIDQMVTSWTMALRLNPGMEGLFKSLGVDASSATEGTVSFVQALDKLRRMPFPLASRYAEMMGISPDQLLQMEQNWDRFVQRIKEGHNLQTAAGADIDKQAEQGMEAANMAGKVSEQLGIMMHMLVSDLIPDMQNLTNHLDDLIKRVDKLINWVRGWAGAAGEDGPPAGSVLSSSPSAWHPEQHGAAARWAHTGLTSYMNMIAPNYSNPVNAGDSLWWLEEKYRLPHGLLDWIWNKESKRSNPNFMLSPQGAAGPFGFKSGTAAEYGVRDRWSFGQSSEGAAKYMQFLIRKYGSVETALQAYNWGPGHMDAYLGAKAAGGNPTMPRETQGYTAGLPPMQVTIYVDGSKTPAQTAKAVKREIETAASDQQRYMIGAAR